jgi:hypothetical protein
VQSLDGVHHDGSTPLSRKLRDAAAALEELQRRRGPGISALGWWALAVFLLVAAAVGLVVLLVGPVAWLVAGDTVRSLPDGTDGKDKADAINAVRGTVLQGAAGLIAVGALWFTARTYLLSREGQVTDR